MFKEYESVPVFREARQITSEDTLEMKGHDPTIWELTTAEGSQVVFDVPDGRKPEYDSWLVKNDEGQVYHCPDVIFREYHLVKDAVWRKTLN